VEEGKYYVVCTNDFIAAGGDGFDMLGELWDEGYEDPFGTELVSVIDVVIWELERSSVMRAGLDGRISVLDSSMEEETGENVDGLKMIIYILVPLCIILCIIAIIQFLSSRRRDQRKMDIDMDL